MTENGEKNEFHITRRCRNAVEWLMRRRRGRHDQYKLCENFRWPHTRRVPEEHSARPVDSRTYGLEHFRRPELMRVSK